MNNSGVIVLEDAGYYEVIYGLNIGGGAESIALTLNSTILPGSVISSGTDMPTVAIIFAVDAAQIPASLSLINNGSGPINMPCSDGCINAFITVKKLMGM